MMKCAACDTLILKIPANWKCPHCGERLPDPSKWELFWDGFAEFLQEKGVIFWSIFFFGFLIVMGLGELLFGTAHLLTYIGTSLFISLGATFFGGMLLDMCMKILLPLRNPYGTDFMLTERGMIRNVRKITYAALAGGIISSFVWIGPKTFFDFFPTYILLMGWWLALGWSIAGLFMDPKWLEDVRFRLFIDKIGVLSLKKYRKLSTIMIGVLIALMIVFNILLSIPGLWNRVQNMPALGVTIRFLRQYLSWLF